MIKKLLILNTIGIIWGLQSLLAMPVAQADNCDMQYDHYLENVRHSVFSQWHPQPATRSYRVKMHLSIGKQGQLLSPPAILQSSGNTVDDQQALAAVHANRSFSPLPLCQSSKAFDMDITLTYDLKLTHKP